MNIIVCLKQVPGTTEVKIDPETNTLMRQGIKNITNPYDTYALEEGIRLRERYGGRVTAISMGPPQAEEILREAIGCGADDAVLVSDRAFAGSDTLATSSILSRAISKIGGYDLVICGRQTIDGDTGQVGPQLGELLETAFIAYVSRVEEIESGNIRVQRMIEGGHEVIEASLPAVITVVKEINQPRLPSLRGLARARNAVIPTWSAADLGIAEETVGAVGSATRVVRIFAPPKAGRGEMLEGSPEEQVASLIARLEEIKIIQE